MSVKLALYKAIKPVRDIDSFGAWIIRTWTSSPYSHCELVIAGFCYSCSIQDSGVRAKAINFDSGNWDFVELPWSDEAAVLSYFEKTKGRPYGWAALILRQVFNIRGSDKASFCSEWVMSALGVPDAGQYSPAGAANLCEWVNNIKR